MGDAFYPAGAQRILPLAKDRNVAVIPARVFRPPSAGSSPVAPTAAELMVCRPF